MDGAVDEDELGVRLLHPAARVPARSRPGDAGYDLHCVAALALEPGQREVVPTGVALALPPGVAGLIAPRSGLAARAGISLVNGPGVVDPNFRGEVCAILVNLGTERFEAEAGDRIAQLVLVRYWTPVLRVVDELPQGEDDRGARGFGSSGR